MSLSGRRWTRSRRSAVLLIMGTVFVLLGLSNLGTQAQVAAAPASARSYAVAVELFSLTVWGWAFIVCGAVAVGAGLTMRHTPGYAALMAISSMWGLCFAGSWITTGYGRAVVGALTWALVVALLAVVAGWDDPPPRRRRS